MTDLPTWPPGQKGLQRSWLSTGAGPDYGQVERLVTLSRGLFVVGSVQRQFFGSIPLVVEVGEATADNPLEGWRVEVPEVGSASAADVLDMPDGSVRVIGWEDDPKGSRVVVWRIGADGLASMDHRFTDDELAPNVIDAELDATGRTWIVSSGQGLDGTIDVAVETTSGWITHSLPAGLVGNVQATTFGDRLSVWASTTSPLALPPSAAWVSNVYSVTGGVVEMTQVPFVDAQRVGDGAWIGDRFEIPVRTAGNSFLASTSDGTTWDVQPVATPLGTGILAVVAAPSGRAVVIGPDNAVEGRWELQVGAVADAAFVPWAAAFTVDKISTPWSNDILIEPYHDGVALLDRQDRHWPDLVVVEPERVGHHDPALYLESPQQIGRVTDLLPSAEGLVAVVGRWSATEPGFWSVDQSEIYIARDAGWTGITRAFVSASTSWRGEALLAIPFDDSFKWMSIRGDELVEVGSTTLFDTVDDMVTVGDELFVVAVVDGRRRLYAGPVEGTLRQLPLPATDHDVAEVCADDRVRVVVDSLSDGSRSLAAVVDGRVELLAELPVAMWDVRDELRDPLCWLSADQTAVLGELQVLEASTTPIIDWVARDESGLKVPRAGFGQLPGSVGYDVLAGDYVSHVVGVAHDRHGDFDAVWWSVPERGELVRQLVFGGSGRQEAISVLQIEDAVLIGGTDNGEPVIWIIPDG